MIDLSEIYEAIRKAQDEAVCDSTKKGSVDAYNFEDGQLISSVHSTKKRNEDGSMASKSIGATKFEPYDFG